jgi:hypothetical protein
MDLVWDRRRIEGKMENVEDALKQPNLNSIFIDYTFNCPLHQLPLSYRLLDMPEAPFY